MACDHCLGSYEGCKYCGAPPLEPCPDCDDGYRYFLIDPVTEEWIPCTKEDYNIAPAEYRDYEICETCKGEGYIYD